MAGPFVVQLIVNDGLLDSLPDTTLIIVNALENRPPSAVNDEATTPESVPVLIDVLDNDSDPDGDPLTVTEVSSPAGGTTAIEANQVRFTPDAGFSGVTSFTYGISDGRGGNSSATVMVTVTSGNRAPVADAGPDQSVYLGDAIAVDGGDSSDPDGDPIAYLWTVQSAPRRCDGRVHAIDHRGEPRGLRSPPRVCTCCVSWSTTARSTACPTTSRSPSRPCPRSASTASRCPRAMPAPPTPCSR